MAWTTPAQTTTGQVVTSAFWNAQIPDNFDAAFPDGVTTNDWDATLTATGSNPTLQSNVGLEARVAGFQFFWAALEIATPGAGDYILTLPDTAAGGLTVSTTAGVGQRIGGFHLRDLSPSFMAGGSLLLRTTTTAHFNAFSGVGGAASGVIGATNPKTLAEGDTLTCYGSYPVA